MTIENFTPLSAFLGGLVIGIAVMLFFAFNGRLIGISGIARNFLNSNDKRFDNFLFLIGLILGPIIYQLFSKEVVSINITNSIYLLGIAGLLVGLGTSIGSGCTSGHGICGISRFSLRSIIATITFMIVGILTVFMTNLI
jgi:uncharacterized membrane protein YedE/YeeE